MTLKERLLERSENKCELCQAETNLEVYEIPPVAITSVDNSIIVCEICANQLTKTTELNPQHWRCLTSSMWSEVPAVQVVSWRMLNRLKELDWAASNLDMMYLEEETLSWAKLGLEDDSDAPEDIHKDANGNQLLAGDSVVLTKSLDVKGSTLNAKMGTVVKNIKLVNDNTDQIEGKIEGQVIVILTKFVRKQGV